MTIAIIDLGISNIASVKNTLENLGFNSIVTSSPEDLNNKKKIILPGVGSFPKAMQAIKLKNWDKILKKKIYDEKSSILGICLGMQILGSIGYEIERTEGLNFIEGSIESFEKNKCNLLLPHVGWNEVHYSKNNPMFEKIPNNSDFYFVHSYIFREKDKENISATTKYKISFTSAIKKNNIWGVQFHPEKSSVAGKQLLSNFANI